VIVKGSSWLDIDEFNDIENREGQIRLLKTNVKFMYSPNMDHLRQIVCMNMVGCYMNITPFMS